MKLEGHQQRLTIYVGESDRHGHTPLATEIVQRAHTAGRAGASVVRGVEGYGAANHIHTTRILSLSDDLPMAIVIVDAPSAIAAFLSQLDELRRRAEKTGVQDLECGWILDDNHAMTSVVQWLGAKRTRRFGVYERTIESA